MTAKKSKKVVVNVRELQAATLPKTVTVNTTYLDFLKEATEFVEDSGVDPKNVSTANAQSSTKTFFKNRALYKKYVNDLNLPIGLYNPKGVKLKNQLDVWYERPTYGKVDDFGSLTTLKTNAPMVTVSQKFKLVDFAGTAFNDLLVAYNEKRRDDPRSILNQIKAVRAYEPVQEYRQYALSQYLDAADRSLYRQFFEKALKPNRYNSQIKGFEDFYNLFFAYIRNNSLSFTAPAYYESSHNSIYASGLVVDIVRGDKTSDDFKSQVINDVRFPVLNYVAKMHGFKIDPNNPWRLIADLSSDIMINKYMKPAVISSFTPAPAAIIAEIYNKYYEDIYQVGNLATFALILAGMYGVFIEDYPFYSTYEADTSLKQLFQKKFEVIENRRPPISDELVGFLPSYYYEWLSPPDQATLFPKKLLADQYVDFRIMEIGAKISNGVRTNLKENFYSLLQAPSLMALKTTDQATIFELNPATKDVNLLNREAFYYLERSLGLPSSRHKKDLTSSPKGYIFIFGKGNPLFTL